MRKIVNDVVCSRNTLACAGADPIAEGCANVFIGDFRFYDPRILRAFLPACTSDELRSFFGPVQRFYSPTGGNDGLLAFALRDGKLRVTRLDQPTST